MISHSLKTLAAATALLLPVLAAVPGPARAADVQRPKGCVVEAWPAFLDPWHQTHRIRERIKTDAGEVLAIQFGPLKGEYAKLFMFMLVHDGCDRKIVVVSSFNFMTDIARQRGDVGPGQRIYELDLYTHDQHKTLELMHRPPSYAEAKAKALDLLR